MALVSAWKRAGAVPSEVLVNSDERTSSRLRSIKNARANLLTGEVGPDSTQCAPTFRSGRGVPEGLGSVWPDRSPHLNLAIGWLRWRLLRQ